MQLFRYASSMRSEHSGVRLPGTDFVCLHVFANINSLLTCIKLTKTLLIYTEKHGCKMKINNYCFFNIFVWSDEILWRNVL